MHQDRVAWQNVSSRDAHQARDFCCETTGRDAMMFAPRKRRTTPSGQPRNKYIQETVLID